MAINYNIVQKHSISKDDYLGSLIRVKVNSNVAHSFIDVFVGHQAVLLFDAFLDARRHCQALYGDSTGWAAGECELVGIRTMDVNGNTSTKMIEAI